MEKINNQKKQHVAGEEPGVKLLKRNIVFICFLTLLGLFYIANSHSSEKKVRQIIALKSEIKELNWQYLSLKSDLVQGSLYSSVQSKLTDEDLNLRGNRPVKIITNQY